MERLAIIPGIAWAIAESVRTIVSPVAETPHQILENTFRSKLTEAEQNLLDDFLMTVQHLKNESGSDFLVLLVGRFARLLNKKNFGARQPKDIEFRVVSFADSRPKFQNIVTSLQEQEIPLTWGFKGPNNLQFTTQKRPGLRPFRVVTKNFELSDLRRSHLVLLDTRD